MIEAYRLTRKDGAPGIDGVTAADYEVNLEANLLNLLERIKSGRYHAPPVRRAYIPKADGSQRMLGIPAFEDKVAQRAVTMVLEAIYEQDFLPCSYGFRPGRSAHQALRTLQNALWAKRLYWVLDIDIRKYLDASSHYTSRFFERGEEVCSNCRYLNSYAFCPSAIDVNSLELATLYTLQDRLPRDTE